MTPIKITSNLPNDLLRIELFLGNTCNYNCWYCYPGSHEGDIPWPKLDLIIENLNHLIEYYRAQGKKRVHIHIIGGEPTLWKEFGIFVQQLKQKQKCVISISTNASRTLRWWNEYGHYIDHVMISCHQEQVDIEHVIGVADLLYSKQVSVSTKVLMDPNEWNKCVAIVDRLKTSKKRWPVSVLEVFHDSVTYTDKQKQYIGSSIKRWPNLFYYLRTNKMIRKNATVTFLDGNKKTVPHNWLSLNGQNSFYGWSCNIGVDTIYIDPYGNIGGACGEKLFDLDFKYNIFDQNFNTKFNPILKPTTCKTLLCQCQPEINCTKEKINNRKVIPLVPS